MIKELKNLVALLCFVFVFECVFLGMNNQIVGAAMESVTKQAIAGAEVLPLDELKSITLTSDVKEKFYSFTPSVNGIYKMESSGEVDTYITVYDNRYKDIKSFYSGGVNANFSGSLYLQAGKTYYFNVSFESTPGNFSFWTTKLTDMAVQCPAGVSFLVGTKEAEFKDLTATLSYSDGKIETLNWNAIKSSLNNKANFTLTYNPIVAGSNTINVTYGDFTKSFTVTGDSILNHQIASISLSPETERVVTSTTNGEYSYFYFVPTVSGDYNFKSNGDYYDTVETRQYSNEVSTNVYDSNGMLVNKIESKNDEDYVCNLEAGKTYYMCSNIPDGFGKYTVTMTKVKDINSVQIVRLPFKTDHIIDYESMSFDGLIVQVNYKDGSNTRYNVFSGYGHWDNFPYDITCSALTRGDNVVTISYRGKTATYTMKGITVPDKFTTAGLISGKKDTTFDFVKGSDELVHKYIPAVNGEFILEVISKNPLTAGFYDRYGKKLEENRGALEVDGKFVVTYSLSLDKNKEYYIVTENWNNDISNPFTIEIKTKTPYTVPTGITATYKQKLKQIALPAGFSWEGNVNTVLSTVGKHVFTAKYVPTDGKTEVTGIEITVTVKEPVYKITYKLNGGTNHKSNPKSYGLLAKDLTLKNPTKKGYVFGGWYSDSKFKKAVKSIAKTSEKNVTLYAKWTKVTVSKATLRSLVNMKSLKIVASFNKISKVKGYQVVYATNSKFSKSKSIFTTKTSFTLSKCKKGTTYYFKVRGYKLDSAGNKVYGSYSSTKKIKVSK